MRLDSYLHNIYPDVSRSSLQKLIKDGSVKVNDSPATKSGQQVSETDNIAVDYDFESLKNAGEINIDVLYEDDDCVVINKPLGVLTHSKGAFNPEGTVATWLSKRKNFNFDTQNNSRAGIVHRLDRSTSGVMICAKNQKALGHLQKQFQDRKAKKTYIARIEGVVTPRQALIDLPIERNPKQPQKFRVGANGKSAQTAYKVYLELQNASGKSDSLLELKPVTGRTHQLRVHLDYLKHPIVGDQFYGGRQARRLYLHAFSLEITLPSKERRTFSAAIPPEFEDEETQ